MNSEEEREKIRKMRESKFKRGELDEDALLLFELDLRRVDLARLQKNKYLEESGSLVGSD